MKDNEKSFGVFPYQFKIVGYVLSAIGIILFCYYFLTTHDGVRVSDEVKILLLVAFTFIAFSKSKVFDERDLYLNTKLLTYSFLLGVCWTVFYYCLGRVQITTIEWPLLIFVAYFGMKIKYKLLDRKNDEKEI